MELHHAVRNWVFSVLHTSIYWQCNVRDRTVNHLLCDSGNRKLLCAIPPRSLSVFFWIVMPSVNSPDMTEFGCICINFCNYKTAKCLLPLCFFSANPLFEFLACTYTLSQLNVAFKSNSHDTWGRICISCNFTKESARTSVWAFGYILDRPLIKDIIFCFTSV